MVDPQAPVVPAEILDQRIKAGQQNFANLYATAYRKAIFPRGWGNYSLLDVISVGLGPIRAVVVNNTIADNDFQMGRVKQRMNMLQGAIYG